MASPVPAVMNTRFRIRLATARWRRDSSPCPASCCGAGGLAAVVAGHQTDDTVRDDDGAPGLLRMHQDAMDVALPRVGIDLQLHECLAGARLHQREQGQSPGAEAHPRFARRQALDQWFSPAAPHRSRQGHRCSTATPGCSSASSTRRQLSLLSTDFGETFMELEVDPDPRERDIHRILVHPERPDPHHRRERYRRSDDQRRPRQDLGAATRCRTRRTIPTPSCCRQTNPDLAFMTAGTGLPSNWYVAGRGRGKILRSRDGGATCNRGCSAVCRTASARCSLR